MDKEFGHFVAEVKYRSKKTGKIFTCKGIIDNRVAFTMDTSFQMRGRTIINKKMLLPLTQVQNFEKIDSENY